MVRWFAGLQKQQIEPDFIDLKKTVPGCMEEYEYLFGVTRIPAQDIDHFVNVDSKHIAVIRGADIFTVDVIDANGAVASEAAIKAAMDQISAGIITFLVLTPLSFYNSLDSSFEFDRSWRLHDCAYCGGAWRPCANAPCANTPALAAVAPTIIFPSRERDP